MSRYHMNKTALEVTDKARVEDLMRRSKYMTVAMCTKSGEPYVVTLNYGYDAAARRCYFHCSRKGRKLDILAENPSVCATVISDGGYVDGDCIHLYETAVIWGRMTAVEGAAEKTRAFEVMFAHLESRPDEMKARFFEDEKALEGVRVLALDIETIDCKSNIKKK